MNSLIEIEVVGLQRDVVVLVVLSTVVLRTKLVIALSLAKIFYICKNSSNGISGIL